MTSDACSQNTLAKNETIHGCIIKRSVKLQHIGCTAYVMEHIKSGAKIIYLSSNDIENLFSIAFRTPPQDDTGLPHILEHTVLCGSRKYPVKDPFIELVKYSLATFLNAMTYPDKTVYPCASMNENDFHNIMRVYCDSVFFPLLTKEHFKQEGHHLAFTSDETDKENLTVQGVVFNEMKGVYSDLNGIIAKEEAKSILPDNAYGNDSGGDPISIPNLTYDEFINFHKKYYHPSNSYIFIYGSFDINKTLKILNEEYLSKFDKTKILSEIATQHRWEKPKVQTVYYPLDEEVDENKITVTVNFLTNSVTDTFTSLAMALIDSYLLDNAASPLRKALIDSNLGEALTNSGYSDYQRDTYFTIGLKNIKSESSQKIVEIIFKTLKEVISLGFEPEKIQAAIHRMEFESKEIQPSYPLVLMDRIYNHWIYDSDPLSALEIDKELEKLKERCFDGTRFLENLVEQYLLNNNHYTVVIYRPDKDYFSKKDEEFIQQMAEIKKSLTMNDILKIKEENALLKKMHESPNSPEALATLPKLKLDDISASPTILNSKIDSINSRPFITTDINSNGICYITIAFDISDIKEELLPYVAVYKTLFLKVGADKYNYIEMAEREANATGGISAGLNSTGKFDNSNCYMPLLTVSAKFLSCRVNEALTIVKQRILSPNFNDTNRVKDLLFQFKTNLKDNILSSGTSYAVLSAESKLNLNAKVNEIFNGISYVRFIDKTACSFGTDKDSLINKLQEIHSLLMNKNRLTLSVVGDEKSKLLIADWFANLLMSMNDCRIEKKEVNFTVKNLSANGIIIPSDVSFNASVFSAVNATSNHAPALMFLSQHLTYGYLWDEIRTKRGAYGVSASFSTLDGVFSLSSYRDPCIKETYKVFDSIYKYIKNEMDLNPQSLEQSIIGTFKKLDSPVRPSVAVSLAMTRILKNITEEYRKIFRMNLLSLTKKEILDSASFIFESSYPLNNKCTISGKSKFQSLKNFNLDLEEL